MKTVILTNEELWMLRITLENELEKYNYWYKPDERTEINICLLQSLIHKFEREPEKQKSSRVISIT